MIESGNGVVLVTGATGFVGMHCIVKLLQDGWRVRGTMRDLGRAEALAKVIGQHAEVGDRLTFVQADLGSDRGWAEAALGCQFVLHVASPVLASVPANPEEVIGPARDGTLRVLKAAAHAGVRRVVLTSSTGAVLYGHPRDGSKTYDESYWSNLDADVAPYERSKTLAERAAWDYVDSLPQAGRMELVTIQPGLILGPLLDKDFSVSGEVVRKLMAREVPGCPDLGWAVVDVRDVADVQVSAMTHPLAAGKRFIIASDHVPMQAIAQILARHFGPRGFKVPTRRVPSWVLKLLGTWDKTIAMTVPELGQRQDLSAERARQVLGWLPRDVETMVVDMAESMIRHGVIPARVRPPLPASAPTTTVR
jgi:nucleoside-diphosphate-sugar epimerase